MSICVYCDGCNKEIKPSSGYAIHGNVGIATTGDKFLGLIGDNFPQCDANSIKLELHTSVTTAF